MIFQLVLLEVHMTVDKHRAAITRTLNIGMVTSAEFTVLTQTVLTHFDLAVRAAESAATVAGYRSGVKDVIRIAKSRVAGEGNG